MCRQFHAEVEAARNRALEREPYWIVKPVGGQGGRGIRIVRNADVRPSMLPCDRSDMVVQEYVRDPMLLERRKFDIRCYLLVASTQPMLVFFYPGYVRRTMQAYNWNDTLINNTNIAQHLTNTHLQRVRPNYRPAEHIWSLQQFDNYLRAINATDNFAFGPMMERLRKLARFVFESGRAHLQVRPGGFHMFGTPPSHRVPSARRSAGPSAAHICSPARLPQVSISSSRSRAIFICWRPTAGPVSIGKANGRRPSASGWLRRAWRSFGRCMSDRMTLRPSAWAIASTNLRSLCPTGHSTAPVCGAATRRAASLTLTVEPGGAGGVWWADPESYNASRTPRTYDLCAEFGATAATSAGTASQGAV